MRIAVLGSAPSSLHKAPFGDASWEIWACSPGTYAHLGRCDEFFEVHRWEPGVIGKAATQKAWFTPEYVAWMRLQKRVWVADTDALKDLPNAAELPWRALVTQYGHYCWTSTISYMLAMAINKIVAAREQRQELAKQRAGQPSRGLQPPPAGMTQEAWEAVIDASGRTPDAIGLWGVDMAANEELYTGQRAAAQWFLQMIVGLGIEFTVPPESDLCTPPPMYGVCESTHRYIKLTERHRELQQRLAAAQGSLAQAQQHVGFLQGALDDNDYHMKMWQHEGDALAFDYSKFPALGQHGAANNGTAPPEAEVIALPARATLPT
jgi:hypothetical protein